MALLNADAQRRVDELIRGVATAYTVYAIGRSDNTAVREMVRNFPTTEFNRMTWLEQTYVAGKLAQLLGPTVMKGMNEEQLRTLLEKTPVPLTSVDYHNLETLKADTDRYIKSRAAAWEQQVAAAIAQEDRDWNAVLSASEFDEPEREEARDSALNSLLGGIGALAAGMVFDADRLAQTEMNSYFQSGQVSGLDGDEIVYKIPRPTACEHCVRLHLEDDGSPIQYLLSEVIGNSNEGLPAYAWEFTVGPVHPHCYCILYREVQDPSGPDEGRAAARRETLNPEDDEELDLEKSLVSESLERPCIEDSLDPHIVIWTELVAKIYGSSETLKQE